MEIETSRLLLRPLRDDDAIAMAQALNNINVSRNLARVKHPYVVADAADFIAKQRSFDPRSVVSAITFRAAPDELIGVVAYEYGLSNDGVEFGYWLRECCWHMGLMSEAAAALVHYAFAEGGVEVLKSGHHTANPNSGRILRKLGFIETNREMSFGLAQGKEVATIRLNFTRESWAAQQKGRAA